MSTAPSLCERRLSEEAVALGFNGIALLLMVGPSLIDRFLHL